MTKQRVVIVVLVVIVVVFVIILAAGHNSNGGSDTPSLLDSLKGLGRTKLLKVEDVKHDGCPAAAGTQILSIQGACVIEVPSGGKFTPVREAKLRFVGGSSATVLVAPAKGPQPQSKSLGSDPLSVDLSREGGTIQVSCIPSCSIEFAQDTS
jgi:hypothetical protein